ncbi:MAG: protein-ADP-ribose hydrolase [Anaerovibrio sp.]|uniref:protein-ADP-ribose hydrolase n=1 Tax=Anaerovibrio sp. TaxID=1872532 RepID=UPI0025E49F01|nr:protein-ADP-ribose hydrolase [Anaerovibrio sp.]MCR5176152.1 protein-ADP-ribose hydrolase [Anaerovibrio sp.]
MNQQERRKFLIEMLLGENPKFAEVQVERETNAARKQLRSLMNIRPAAPMPKGFREVQDEYLQGIIRDRGIVEIADMEEMKPGVYLWQGDITRISCDAIVNAANSGLTGCYQPCHACIDNCIHTYAGIQLRIYCQDLMDAQGYGEPTGQGKITPAFNLPCKYVIHTVGPIVHGALTREHERLLRSCYDSCLKLAYDKGLKSIAFCCISTGVFMFPNDRAAKIAVETVKAFKERTGSKIKVIFNVWKGIDYEIYRRLLG